MTLGQPIATSKNGKRMERLMEPKRLCRVDHADWQELLAGDSEIGIVFFWASWLLDVARCPFEGSPVAAAKLLA